MRFSLLATIWVLLADAGQATAAPVIDLSEPGALEALPRANPTNYETVRQIIDGVPARPDAEVPRWMRVSFDARDVSHMPVAMTSHPPKRRLAFALHTTRYETIVTVTNVRGTIVPAR